MISGSFSRCLAKICGDGYLCRRYMRYSNTAPELLAEFKRDMLEEFEDLHFIKGVGNSGTPFIQVQSKKIIDKFLSCLNDFRSSSIKIPDAVLNSGLNIKLQFIRALYDDEGCAALRLSRTSKWLEWKRNITLTSNSRAILGQISQALNSLGIRTNKIIPNNKNRSDDNSFVLSITGRDNFIKFREFIGFKHLRKSRILDFIIESYTATPKKNTENFINLKSKLGLE